MRTKILWGICLGNLFVVFCFFLLYVLGLVPLDDPFAYLIILIIPVIQLCVHSSFFLSVRRAVLFIIISVFFSFASEYIGTHFGAIFGVPYIYKTTTLMIANIPIEVMGFWSFFIYLGYSLTNSLYFGLTGKKVAYSLLTILTLTFLDALFVTAIDLFMDPLHVKMGTWTWLQQGTYFGIPISNFTGWFSVAFLSSGFFRLFMWVKKEKLTRPINSTEYIQPLNYFAFAIGFASFSLTLGMWQLAIIGCLFMLPQAILTLFLLSRKIRI